MNCVARRFCVQDELIGRFLFVRLGSNTLGLMGTADVYLVIGS